MAAFAGARPAASRNAALASWNCPRACSARPARASSDASRDDSASAATRESVARAMGRLSICCSNPSSSAASLAGAREAAACNAVSASAYIPRSMAARARSATTLGSLRSSFAVSVSTSAYRPSMNARVAA